MAQRLPCCNVRKVQPLTRHLATLDAWITGLRRDQWATRTDIRKIELDHDHGGIVKLNPLAEWTEEEVWDYVRERDVPYHPLYDRGYTSIGCAPCTRALAPGEKARDGRWWWEVNAPKECGIHCAVETGGLEHELHAILGEEARVSVAVAGEAREVALAEAQASWQRGARLTSSWRRSTRARSSRRSRRLSGSWSSGSRPGESARSTARAGSRRRCGCTGSFPTGPRPAATVEAVNEALRALSGRELESVQLRAVGPARSR